MKTTLLKVSIILKAYDLYLKSKGTSISERSKSLSSAAQGNTDIISGLSLMDQKDLERTQKKFEVAYFVAKQQLPMSSAYPNLLQLELKHGVDVKGAYQNNVSCGTFIEYIGDDLKQNLNTDLAKAKFFSVLRDGSTDSAVIKNEVIYALHFDPTPSNSDSVEVQMSFLHMHQTRHQNADGIAATLSENLKDDIEKGFQSIGIKNIEASKKLIGFTSDGASVNRGNKHSIKTILREKSEWLIFVWCIAHRLELALGDALKGTVFDDIDEILLRVYYLYQKAPKKTSGIKRNA